MLMIKRSFPLVAGLLVALLASPLQAQTVNPPTGILPEQQRATPLSEEVDDTPRADWRSGTHGPVPQERRVEAADSLPPFGANLFEGGFRGATAEGLNPGYRIKPGDRVTLRAWGAVEIDRVLTVDAQGNIFIPSHALPVQVNRNGLRFILQGSGRYEALTVLHVPDTADIREGDLLITSGLAGRFPPGYPVARVAEVVHDPGQPFARVTATPVAQLQRSRHFLLLFPPPAPATSW